MKIVSGEESLTTYTFYTHTAEHYFCRVCGIYPFHRKRVAPDYFGVNVHCLDGFNPGDIQIKATDGKGMD